MSATDWVEQLKGIALDLTTVEVNTIEAEGMTGRKMPAWPLALVDVASKYADFLTGPQVRLDLDRFAADFAAGKPSDGGQSNDEVMVVRGPPSMDVSDGFPPAGDKEQTKFLKAMRSLAVHLGPDRPLTFRFQLTNGPETFLLLFWAAANLLTMPLDKSKIEPGARVILLRIQRNSEQLVGLSRTLLRLAERYPNAARKVPNVSDLHPTRQMGFTRVELEAVDIGGDTVPKAPAELLNRLRKIWDIGAETIVMQTVVQLDGDLVFRASNSILEGHSQHLVEAHERMTKMALSYWRNLFDLVTGLLLNKTGRVLDRTFKSGTR